MARGIRGNSLREIARLRRGGMTRAAARQSVLVRSRVETLGDPPPSLWSPWCCKECPVRYVDACHCLIGSETPLGTGKVPARFRVDISGASPVDPYLWLCDCDTLNTTHYLEALTDDCYLWTYNCPGQYSNHYCAWEGDGTICDSVLYPMRLYIREDATYRHYYISARSSAAGWLQYGAWAAFLNDQPKTPWEEVDIEIPGVINAVCVYQQNSCEGGAARVRPWHD